MSKKSSPPRHKWRGLRALRDYDDEYFSAFEKFYENVESKGLTLGSSGNKKSGYVKTNLSIEKTDLNEIIKSLEKELDIHVVRIVSKRDYTYDSFEIVFIEKKVLILII